jgi:hypothetical protein
MTLSMFVKRKIDFGHLQMSKEKFDFGHDQNLILNIKILR